VWALACWVMNICVMCVNNKDKGRGEDNQNTETSTEKYKDRISEGIKLGRQSGSGDRMPVGARFSAPVHTGLGFIQAPVI
jgi:hypothetical protein